MSTPAVGRQLLAVVALLAVAGTLLAPWSCVQACATGGPGCGPTTCATVLGLPAPLGEGWLLVPLVAVAALVATRRVQGHALLLLGALASAGLTVAVLAVREQLPATAALALGAVVVVDAALLPGRERAQRRLALTAVVVVLGAAGVVSAWREDGSLRLWQVVVVLVVAVGVVRAVRQLRRPPAAAEREGG